MIIEIDKRFINNIMKIGQEKAYTKNLYGFNKK